METKGVLPCNNNKTKANKMKRKEILEKKKAMDELIKVASAEKDHLSSFHAFRHYQKNGLSACLESGTGDQLSSSLKYYIQNLLKANMEGPYGTEWPVEEKVKRREMVASEARYIFVYEALDANANELLTVSGKERTSGICMEERGSLLGFVHFRFVIEEDLPVLYVYELQLESHVQGKGLGKFLMQLIELIARKNHMTAVVLTVQKANLVAMNFYTSKMRYVISSISPSKVDPWLGTQKSYEILCKSFSNDAKAILEGP
ncbi:PREDICTED: N-alpha-acetyltransferase 40 isoform X2 [Fragaria vesca subsp. vesca]|uniref:N-alpha-acetyltransferase 40 isoform X2 n=1 Tax=Fragaria vesca subsp. vesca TaxID=101020 RepID=UPI0002C34E56|nr:PREDICTED: N-alpha-acetyltransferase 40 isoform X2 [Fragaria vesca subsp. vesca]XP_011464466.1 PREDICTED: N-alpha-acetyltransferase 40 isoform X2 [Fragaria vesca subsp. vesca]